MQYVLNSENSQRKTGIYLKLNLGLKALLIINGLMSWVLSDREVMLCSETTQHYGVWEEICFFCSLNFSWWVTSAEVWFPTADAGAHQRVQFPAVRSWRSVSLKDEVWPSDMVTSSLTWIIFVPHLSLHTEISLLHKSWEGRLAPESCNLALDQSF